MLTVRISRKRQINENDRGKDYIKTKMTASREMIDSEPNIHNERDMPRVVRMAKIKEDE